MFDLSRLDSMRFREQLASNSQMGVKINLIPSIGSSAAECLDLDFFIIVVHVLLMILYNGGDFGPDQLLGPRGIALTIRIGK